jgi:hypothetical protein
MRSWAGITQPITTRTYELRSEIDLTNVLGYMVKPINLPQCYLAAWPAAEANDRAGVPWLNQGVDDIVRGFELNVGAPFWFDQFNPAADGKRKRRRPCRHQFGYMGCMHSRHRAYVGFQPEQRDTHCQRDLLTAILTEQRLAKALGLWQPDWLGTSVEEIAASQEAGSATPLRQRPALGEKDAHSAGPCCHQESVSRPDPRRPGPYRLHTNLVGTQRNGVGDLTRRPSSTTCLGVRAAAPPSSRHGGF